MSYRPASSVDRISDYNGFSPCRSREVDRVYSTLLFKATFLFNCIIPLIFILVFCSLRVYWCLLIDDWASFIYFCISELYIYIYNNTVPPAVVGPLPPSQPRVHKHPIMIKIHPVVFKIQINNIPFFQSSRSQILDCVMSHGPRPLPRLLIDTAV